MKNLFLFFAFIFCLKPSTNAQTIKPEPVVVNVTYQFIYINDLNDKDKPIKKDMILSVGKSSSRYITAETYNRVMTPPPVPTAGARIYAGRPAVMVNSHGGIVNENIFQYPLSGAMNILAVLGNNYYIAETKLTKINWKTLNETKEIGGFSCQKAVGDFGGRKYTVWFTPDLPFQNGPFKLWGLPGLILEAEDSKKEVRFLFKDINRETDASRKVDLLNASPVKITIDEYNKAKKAYQTSPDTYMQGQLSANAPKVTKLYENEADKNATKKILPNPIEL